MKKVSLLLLAVSLATFSCKKKGCIDKEATNYNEKAKKDDGTCIFPSALMEGTYNVTESCYGLGNDNYTITIVATGNTTVRINSILGGTASMIGSTTDGKSLKINAQSAIPDKSNYYWDMDNGATGFLDGNTLTLNYQMDDILYGNNYGTVNCTATCNK